MDTMLSSSPRVHYAPIDKAECGSINTAFQDDEALNRKKRNSLRWRAFALAIFLTIIGALTFTGYTPLSPARAIGDITGRADFNADAADFMDVFQLYKPVSPVEDGEKDECKVLLMEHRFGFSYGHPFVGNYEPPTCDFNTVTINLTVTSKGRQFDRLALMYLGDIEVFRTSTAEPTSDGIVWTYIKEMSQYNSLWKKPQKLIFDLGNLIDDTYTAPFDVTLTASFSQKSEPARAADSILPISAQNASKNSPSAFTVPADNATVLHKLPINTSRAVVSISACGQSAEEFWYSNVLSKDTHVFNDTVGELGGFSPFREVQLLIDGTLSGVVWPSPVVFTGGIAPGFWRPMVGIDAFDLREPEIDITPFLPVLTDGKPHAFEIRVVGLDDKPGDSLQLSKTVGSYWVVTGKIFLFQDGDGNEGKQPKNAADKDCKPQIIAPEPVFSVTRYLGEKNDFLSYLFSASRSLEIKSCGSSWTQSLSYTNTGLLDGKGVSQFNDQYTSSQDETSGPGRKKSTTTSSYPITVNSTYTTDEKGFEIEATLNRGLSIVSDGGPSVSTFTLSAGKSDLDSRMYGTASYVSKGEESSSSGETTQYFRETSNGEIYKRNVRAINGSVVFDGPGEVKGDATVDQLPCSDKAFSRDSVRGFLGRGPGKASKGGNREGVVVESVNKPI